MQTVKRHPSAIIALLVLTLLIAAFSSLSMGSTRLSLPQILASLQGNGSWSDNLILLQLRLPRILLGSMIGMAVAVSGVILQGITRNDLAGPDTVGVNAGSGLGMMFLLVMYPTATTQYPWLLSIAAVTGSMAITVLVFAMAYRQGNILPSRLLLVGIAMGMGAHAAMLFFSLRMSTTTYNFVVSWLSGNLATGDWNSIACLLPCFLLLIPITWSRFRILNAFLLGDDAATSLGVAVERQRMILLTLATVLTSICVAMGGHIGFLGLAAPHLARRLVGPCHGWLFPAAGLCGAVLLVTADALGRILFAPIEMPAGVFVGVLGGVYFLYLLARTKG